MQLKDVMLVNYVVKRQLILFFTVALRNQKNTIDDFMYSNACVWWEIQI